MHFCALYFGIWFSRSRIINLLLSLLSACLGSLFRNIVYFWPLFCVLSAWRSFWKNPRICHFTFFWAVEVLPVTHYAIWMPVLFETFNALRWNSSKLSFYYLMQHMSVCLIYTNTLFYYFSCCIFPFFIYIIFRQILLKIKCIMTHTSVSFKIFF